MENSFYGGQVTAGDILLLCKKTNMPKDALQALSKVLVEASFAPFTRQLNGLLQPESAQNAYRELAAYFKDCDPDGWLMLTANLAAAVRLYNTFYRIYEIEDTIYFATMEIFSRFVREHKASFGRYGFDRAWWTWRQTSGLLLRVGELEFERYALEADCGPLPSGTAVLSVHIPSDARLTRAALDNSYLRGPALLRSLYPDWHYEALWCESWLLSPMLPKWLKKDSGILLFQSDYEILHALPEDNGGEGWIFGKRVTNPAGLPEATSLQKAAKAHLLAGGHIGAAAGRVIKNQQPLNWHNEQ